MGGPGCTASTQGGDRQGFNASSGNFPQAHLLLALGLPVNLPSAPSQVPRGPAASYTRPPTTPHLPAPPVMLRLGNILWS